MVLSQSEFGDYYLIWLGGFHLGQAQNYIVDFYSFVPISHLCSQGLVADQPSGSCLYIIGSSDGVWTSGFTHTWLVSPQGMDLLPYVESDFSALSSSGQCMDVSLEATHVNVELHSIVPTFNGSKFIFVVEQLSGQQCSLINEAYMDQVDLEDNLSIGYIEMCNAITGFQLLVTESAALQIKRHDAIPPLESVSTLSKSADQLEPVAPTDTYALSWSIIPNPGTKLYYEVTVQGDLDEHDLCAAMQYDEGSDGFGMVPCFVVVEGPGVCAYG